MKKILLIAACAFLNMSGIYCQSTDPVKITILKDDVDNFKMFRVSIPLWNLNLNNTNMSGYDAVIGIHAQPIKQLYFHANYSLSLLERLAPDIVQAGNPSAQSAVSVYKDTHSNSFQVDGTYYFSEQTEQKELRIHLKSRKSGNTTVETVTYVKGQEQTKFGLRIGLMKGVTWTGMDDITLQGKSVSDGSTLSMDFQDKSTYMRYSQLRIGVARAKTNNLHVNAEGYGYRTNSGIDYLYADMVLALKQKLEDVLASYYFDGQGTMYYRRYEIDSSTPKSKIGFALGIRKIPLIGAGSLSAEAGIFPGVKAEHNGYLKLGINLLFGTSEKIKGVK